MKRPPDIFFFDQFVFWLSSNQLLNLQRPTTPTLNISFSEVSRTLSLYVMPEPIDALDKGYTFWTKAIFCPSCKIRLNISLSTPEIVHGLVSTSCPFCRTWLVMGVEGSRHSGLYLKLVYLAAQPDKTRYTNDSPATSFSADASSLACATMAELLKNKGYLTTEDSDRINCLAWPHNLYWTRSCPTCHVPVHVNFTPIPLAALTEDKNTFTEAENHDFARFLISCSGGGLIKQILTCENQQCLAKIQVHLVRLEHGGYYMRFWYFTQYPSDEAQRMPFGNSGAVFNQLTTGWLPKNASRDQNTFDFARLLALPPSKQFHHAKKSWQTFQEKVLQVLREGLWPQMELYSIYSWSLDMESMESWLLEALTHRQGTPIDSENGLSIRQFVRHTYLFIHWIGNLKWKKTCPSKSCQAKLDVTYMPMPYETTKKNSRLSKRERDSVYDYMLRYHWDSNSPRWLERCPVCNIKLCVELQPLGFGAYVLDDSGFKVADSNEQLSEDSLIEFGDTGIYFNHLRVCESW